MALPHVDFELLYWRARRSTQRLQCVLRDALARLRSELQLRRLLQSIQPTKLQPELEPEETIVYRAMWAIVLAGFALVLTIELIGEDHFLALVEAFFGRNA